MTQTNQNFVFGKNTSENLNKSARWPREKKHPRWNLEASTSNIEK